MTEFAGVITRLQIKDPWVVVELDSAPNKRYSWPITSFIQKARPAVGKRIRGDAKPGRIYDYDVMQLYEVSDTHESGQAPAPPRDISASTILSSPLAKLDAIKSLLAKTGSVEDVKDIRDKAEALRVYAKQAGYGLEIQNRVAELKLRAERKAGELLVEIVRPGNPQLSHDVTIDRLPELGIDRMQSSRWQLEASVPEPEFIQYISETCEAGKELTSVGLIRLAARLRVPEERSVPPPEGKYRCLVIDPPWPAGKIERDERPLQGNALPYPSWMIARITGLRLPADETGCHVYLWTTHRFLPNAFGVFKAWGVEYECLLTWVKNVGFTPYSFMYSTEHVLFGRIGNLEVLKKGERLDFQAKVREHSRKPAEFYELVKRVSPEPRLDMFSREPHDGFEQWGNETALFAEVTA
jgi:N6-adenosine-specific RNA methylase IME4